MKYGTFAKAPPEALDIMADDLAGFAEFFRDELGFAAFPCFGTLIGILRNEDFIPGDHDIDVCYISTKPTRAEVKKEFSELLKDLKARGMLGRRLGTGQCSVFFGYTRTAFDLFTCWVEDGDLWSPQWGPLGRVEDLLPLAKYRLRDRDIMSVKKPYIVLDRLYGCDWMTPKQEHPSKYLKRGRHL